MEVNPKQWVVLQQNLAVPIIEPKSDVIVEDAVATDGQNCLCIAVDRPTAFENAPPCGGILRQLVRRFHGGSRGFRLLVIACNQGVDCRTWVTGKAALGRVWPGRKDNPVSYRDARHLLRIDKI